MSDNLYIERDLSDYAQEISDEDGLLTREEYLEEMLCDVEYLRMYAVEGRERHHYHSYIISLDGYYWIIKEDICDTAGRYAFMKNANEYMKNMMSNAYCFDSFKDAKKFVNSKESERGWYNLIERTITNLANIRKYREIQDNK